MKFPVLWSGLGCYTVKFSEILAHMELLYNPRVNKVFTSLHTLDLQKIFNALHRCYANLFRFSLHSFPRLTGVTSKVR